MSILLILIVPQGALALFLRTDSTLALPRVATFQFVLNALLFPASLSPKSLSITAAVGSIAKYIDIIYFFGFLIRLL